MFNALQALQRLVARLSGGLRLQFHILNSSPALMPARIHRTQKPGKHAAFVSTAR